MSYRVCIPTAGTGSRLGGLTKFVNKSLVSIANRPTLSHVIEQFPEDVEFVVALGHKGHLVREFLELAYQDRKFFFAEVEPFEGPGSGLGLSLLSCREYLQEPFVFISCDTLVKEDIPGPDVNWMAYAECDDLLPYRTLKVQSGMVNAICEKGEGKAGSHKPYIGLAGIHDFKTFWSAMDEKNELVIQTGEAHGLRGLVTNKIKAYQFTWYDTGNIESLTRTREIYTEPDAPNILEKANEAIWFVGDQAIKFSDDEKFIENRVKRAKELGGYVPEIVGYQPHMYKYSLVKGRVLSEVINPPLFERFLEHAKMFWEPHTLKPDELQSFHHACMSFYRDKTMERVELFYKNFDRQDGDEVINGMPMPKLKELLDSINWEWMVDGLPGRFHGDFHFENILWSESKQRFSFLDWRQDFGGDLSNGDIYYDFAKLLHGLIISHELITRELFSVEWEKNEIRYDFLRKQVLVECEQRFDSWLELEGYDRKKVWIMTALVYLNIAALHHHPYSLLLYALGKTMLFKELDNNAAN
ncbi:phosphotransferase [Sulfuriflexus mobilis]|uniref:phosphotransferase n=1 Tax=Sulfuriflexus mobilis TaxID=1811807 RepID=UPI000F8310F1|nr:phosphotransferase [Sulfuriflexus mobilis]